MQTHDQFLMTVYQTIKLMYKDLEDIKSNCVICFGLSLYPNKIRNIFGTLGSKILISYELLLVRKSVDKIESVALRILMETFSQVYLKVMKRFW